MTPHAQQRAARFGAAVALVVAVGAGVAVAVLRVANEGAEPVGRNWWLAAQVGLGLGYLPAGAALLPRPRCRRLGAAFVVVAGTQLAAAIITEADALASTATTAAAGPVVADVIEFVGLAVLVAVVPWLLPWRAARGSGDPLRWWLALGWSFALLGTLLAVFSPDVPGADIVGPVLLLATVPLVAVGAVVGATRSDQPLFAIASHRFLVWVVLATCIMLVYTVVVAGFGALLGADGPAWLLVAATGGIALIIEPVRGRVRGLVDRVVYGGRDDPLTLVRHLIREVTTAADIDSLLPSLAATLGDALRLDFVAVDAATPTGWRRLAVHGGDTPHHESFPLANGTRRIGRLLVGWVDGSGLRERDRAVLADVVPHVSLTVGLVGLTSELRQSNLAVVTSREEERRRLRRDLHDGLGPTLTGVGMGLRTVVRRLQRDDTDAATVALLDRLANEVDVAALEVKRIVRDLRPTALDDHSLSGALTEFARSLDPVLDVRLVLPPSERDLPAAVEIAAYRIATEALTNVVRHATASMCSLSLAIGDRVEIVVTDDGVGLRSGQRPGVGLTVMRERVSELGGTLEVTTVVPHGTQIHASLPLAVV